MRTLAAACITILVLSGCSTDRPIDPEYKQVRCKQLLQRTEYPALREIRRVQVRTEAAQLGCYK